MNIYALEPGSEFPLLTTETPPFAVDAVLFDGAEESLTAGQRMLLALYRRYGRPIVLNHKEVNDLPRTNYQPINCDYYDNFEAAIVQRRFVELNYLLADGSSVARKTQLRDLKTDRTEEFVQLSDGRWLRLDQIIALDGKSAGDSCRF